MLAACTRRFSSFGSASRSSAPTRVSKTGCSQNVAKSMASSVYSGQKRSLMKQLLRKYTTSGASSDAAAVKRWNLELNKLLKLRYYEQGAAKFAEMKAAGVTPNAVTYAIMFDTFVAWNDNTAVVNMLKEIKDRGLNTYFADKNTELMRLIETDTRDSNRRAVELYTEMIRRRKAGINPFEFTL